MERITIYCVMCLETEVKMYSMNSMMIQIYSDFISIPFKRNLRQIYACYECAYLFHKYQKFKTKCCKAYNILCSVSPEPFEVTEECLNTIDRKQNELVSIMTSLTIAYDYQPEQDSNKKHFLEEEQDEVFDIEDLKYNPMIFDTLSNSEDDPLQIIETQDGHLDIESAMENYIQDNYEIVDIKSTQEPVVEHEFQLLNSKSTEENDIENDYQFINTFQVESSNYSSEPGSMLWLTIQSKENTEAFNNEPLFGSPVQLSEGSLDNESNNDANCDNYLVEQNLETQIEPDIKDDTSEQTVLELAYDFDDKQFVNDLCKKKESNDVSDGDMNSCILSLDSKILNDHMTVTELTPDDAQHEFLLRKKSSNYTRNPYKCDLCFRGFLSKTSYESHLKKHSLENGAFQCDICKLCFIGKSYLNQHRIRMHRRKFSCKICPYVCFAQTQCNAHILSHTGKEYRCKKCGMTYRFHNSLLTHMHLKHSVECVCDFCGSTFASKYGLFSHKHIVHRQEINELLGPKCDECDVHFASELAWKRHRVLCSRHDVQFGCKICGEVCQDSDSLKVHFREHGTIDYSTRKNYLVKTCIFCKMGLPNKIALRDHLITEHPTEITNDSFYQKAGTSYVCEYCGKAFQKHFSLVLHQRKHSDETPYSCPDCGMKTKYKDYLAVHRRTHTDECMDKFQCDLCGRPFSDKGRLVRHMKGHMGIRPFKCVACDKTFMFQCDQRTHYKHVHDKEPYPKRNKNKRSRKKASRARIKVFDNI